MKTQTLLAVVVIATVLPQVGCESVEDIAARQRQSAERSCKDGTAAFVWSKTLVKERLRAPSTADFPFATFKDEYIGNCMHRIISYVDAQNGFGAQIRTYYVADMQYNKERDEWSLVSVRFE